MEKNNNGETDIMTFSRSLFICCTYLVVFVPKAVAVEVLDYYPACDYELLETVKKHRKISLTNNVVTPDEKQNAATRLIASLKKSAAEAGAEALLIIDSNVERPNKRENSNIGSRQYRLFMTAEFINTCPPEEGRKRIVTGFGKDGVKEMEISLAKISAWQKEIEFSEPQSQKFLRPPLAAFTANLSSGVAGLKLGYTKQKVLQTLGTPTFEMFIAPEQQMLAYGRSFFVVFERDILRFVSTDVPWFSASFLSILPFDDRFDDNKFVVEGVPQGTNLSKNMDLVVDFKQHLGKWVKATDVAVLTLTTEQYHSKHSINSETSLVGFSMYSPGYELNFELNFADTNYIYNHLTQWLASRNDEGKLSLASLSAKPLGVGQLDRTTSVYLFSNHLVVEKVGSTVSKVHLLESVFNRNYVTADASWHYGEIKAGMSKQAVINVAAGEVFEWEESLEISTDSDSQNLYFYSSGDDLTLYAAQILIY